MEGLDFGPLWLTVKLAGVTTAVLLVVGTPFAWWLAFTTSRTKPVLETITAMPLVLPPTVLGFYLLVCFSPGSAIGGLWVSLTGTTLTFSFVGLVVASVIYSLPFTVQPLQSAFEALGKRPLEAAAMLRAGRLDTFVNVVLPVTSRAFITAMVLTFAHTLGEFGVVLMVGGNIPGSTKLISIAIYEQVETLDYAQAHLLSGVLLVFSFVVLLTVYGLNRRNPLRVG